MDKIYIMNVKINNVTLQEAVEKIENQIKIGSKYSIYTPNTEIVMMCQKDKEFLKYINNGDMVIPDGIGLVYASKIKKLPLKERTAGYDLSIKLLEIANNNKLKLYMIGGKPGVTDKAAKNIKLKFPDINICGYKHGYFKGTHLDMNGHEEELEVINDINEKSPDILFVGFGAKKQEKWIEYNKNKINATIIIGNGGTIDGIAGNVKRAPDIFIKLGLEWFYRLIKDPKRIKRQIVLPIFMLKIIFGDKNIVRKAEQKV